MAGNSKKGAQSDLGGVGMAFLRAFPNPAVGAGAAPRFHGVIEHHAACGLASTMRIIAAPSPLPFLKPPGAKATSDPPDRRPAQGGAPQRIGSQKETPGLVGPASQRPGSQSGPREPDPLAIWKTPGPIGPWALTPCRPKSAEFQGARFAPRRFRRTRSRRASCWRLWRRFSTPRREWSS